MKDFILDKHMSKLKLPGAMDSSATPEHGEVEEMAAAAEPAPLVEVVEDKAPRSEALKGGAPSKHSSGKEPAG